MKGFCIGEVDPAPPLPTAGVASVEKQRLILWGAAAVAVAGVALSVSLIYSRRK